MIIALLKFQGYNLLKGSDQTSFNYHSKEQKNDRVMIQFFIKLLQIIGATIYSLIHSYLLILFVLGYLFIYSKLSFWALIAIVVVLGGLLVGLANTVDKFLCKPYFYLCKDNKNASYMAMATLGFQ